MNNVISLLQYVSQKLEQFHNGPIFLAGKKTRSTRKLERWAFVCFLILTVLRMLIAFGHFDDKRPASIQTVIFLVKINLQ